MNLPKLQDAKLTKKRVIVRADLDIDVNNSQDTGRLEVLIPTLDYLVNCGCEIIIIGHKGRPNGEVVEELSLEPISKRLEDLLKRKWREKKVKGLRMNMMENVRFDKGEEGNSKHFTDHLAQKGDFFVNEAFAASHRAHASIVGLPKILPHAAGLHFIEEVENLTQVLEKPERPLIVVLGGMKEDKLDYLKDLEKLADKILVGGRLPDYMGDDARSIRSLDNKRKVISANLIMDKEDITIHSIERFKVEIANAKTIVLAGPMGKYEEKGHSQGTKEIFGVIAQSDAFKVAGGGDTEGVINELELRDRFDWISVGGGAMLEFLAKGTLPGIEALLH